MSRTARFAGVWMAALSRRSLDARVRLVSRAACAVVAVLLAVVVGGQVAISLRLTALQRDAYPALRDAHDLSATLAAFRGEVRSTAAPDRADSLAERFHQLARSSTAPGMAAADARFAEYMVQARRSSNAAASAEADESLRVLESQLASDADAAERGIDATLASVSAVQRMVMLLLAAAGTAALLVLVALGVAAQATLAAWANGVGDTLDALVNGDLGVMIRDSEDDLAGRVGAALRRMARQLRENSDVAHALASGAFRRAARGTAPHDPTGVALARVASTMEEIATSAQRVARGDLRATLTPQSPDDAFGQAHAAMMRRITTTLRDVEAARLRIAQEIEAMRDDAAALASASAADADRLRRTVERVSGLAIQVRADAERSESLAQRADDGERLVEEGSATLHTSVHGIREVLQRSDDVQRLARNAGLLAVCAMADAGQVKRSAQATEALEGEARALAAEAAAAARTMTRVMIDGSEKAYESRVAIDRVAGVVHESATMVRELEGTARRRAAELALVDEKVVQVQGTVAQGADRARQLATRLDLLSSHVRQLDAVLRRLNRGHAPVIMATSPATARSGPALYVTPPHAASAIPRLSILAN